MRKINERSICEYLAEAVGVEVLFYVYEFEYESRCIHYSWMGESTKIIKIIEMRLFKDFLSVRINIKAKQKKVL